jgi:hypothetical protein
VFTEHLEQFAGKAVVEFDSADDWQGPDKAYRVRSDFDEPRSPIDRIEELILQPGAADLSALIIGAWPSSYESGGSDDVVKGLVRLANRLPNLRSIFFGDIIVEECELSWINHGDVSPLLVAFPKLDCLRIRGAEGLKFSPARQESLKHLAIESGGLRRSVLRELFRCDLPNLEHLELLLGESNYGFDGGVEDLQPLLDGRLFPKLKYLGLLNSEIADEIAAVVVNSPICRRIETLDLSMGNLTDAGAKALLSLPANGTLKQLKLLHHYVSPAAIDALRSRLSCELEEARSEQEDDEWRPILHAE